MAWSAHKRIAVIPAKPRALIVGTLLASNPATYKRDIWANLIGTHSLNNLLSGNLVERLAHILLDPSAKNLDILSALSNDGIPHRLDKRVVCAIDISATHIWRLVDNLDQAANILPVTVIVPLETIPSNLDDCIGVVVVESQKKVVGSVTVTLTVIAATTLEAVEAEQCEDIKGSVAARLNVSDHLINRLGDEVAIRSLDDVSKVGDEGISRILHSGRRYRP